MEKLRILVVDDSTLFRKGLVSLFASCPDMEVAGEASDGLEAVGKAEKLMPDIVLMDITMPNCDGLEATRRIKQDMPYARIVMLTVSADEQHLFEAIKAGAQGYLLKNLEPEDLFSMLRGVSRGEAPLSPSMAAKILEEFAQQHHHSASSNRANPKVTDREREVLNLVVKGAANKEIAHSLGISESTVKNHLRNIMEKLHVTNRVQAAIRALNEDSSAVPGTAGRQLGNM